MTIIAHIDEELRREFHLLQSNVADMSRRLSRGSDRGLIAKEARSIASVAMRVLELAAELNGASLATDRGGDGEGQ